MKETIVNKLREIVNKITNEDIKIDISIPKDITHGDFTTNIAMRLAKSLGKNPFELAEEIAQKMEGIPNVHKIEIVKPGFINFFLSSPYLIDNLANIITTTKKNLGESLVGRKIIIEFTDPNPFKQLHIGHAYSNTIGEAICRLFESQGAEVKRADYFGDVGMHVAKSIWGLEKLLEEDKLDISSIEKKPLSDRIKYLGQGYAQGSSAYEENLHAQEEMKALNKAIYIIAQDMWREEKNLYPKINYQRTSEINEVQYARVKHLYQLGREWSLLYFETIYKRLGMHFDAYYPESIAAEWGYEFVLSNVKGGIFEKSQGAIIFPGKKYGLHDRVFINSLGLPTYEAKELGLAPWKYSEFAYDQSIIITGNEIDEYFKVLIKALSLVKPELAIKTRHLSHGMVRLASGKKMSSRTGEIVTAEDVLDEAKKLASEKIKESKEGKNEMSDVQADIVAEQVGIGAIKYAFLKSSIGRDVSFSFEESVSFEGNAGPYLQYTYVRTQSILQKAKEKSVPVKGNNNLENEEILLVRQLNSFPAILEESMEQLAPSILCGYLYDVAKLFNLFYQKYRIVDANSSGERNMRLFITQTVGNVLRKGLNILGMSTPEKM